MTLYYEKIAILGGGPSAAFAYKACKDFGRGDVTVFANDLVFPRGAFFLHDLPPTVDKSLLEDYRRKVIWTSIGDAKTYAYKMWGDKSVETSFPREWREQEAYSAEVLGVLWGNVKLEPTDPLNDDDVRLLARQFDFIIQTFPTKMSFRSQPERRRIPILYRPFPETPTIMILYSGDTSEWVRMTVGNGSLSFEFPSDWEAESQTFPGAWKGMTYPDITPDTEPNFVPPAPNVMLVGRYATWDRKALSHEAYEQVMRALRHPRKVDVDGEV